MMINKDEKRLLLSIKIIPLVIFSVIAVVGTLIALYLIHMNFDNEIAKVKSVYLKQQKKVIKQEVVKIRNNIQNEKKLTEEKLKENIKSYVHSAYAIVNNIYEQNKDKSEEQILKMAKDALRDIRFNDNRGYFFMYKMDGKVLLLPTNKNFEGKNFINLKDAKGKYTVRDMRDLTLKNGESFYTWWWYKPNETEFQSKKIGFAKYFEPLDCFIGTGEYVKDFEETVKKSITKRLSLYTYGKDSYIFIFNKYGKILAHKDQELIGKTSLVYQGIENKTLTQDMVEVSKGEGNFYKYTYLNNKVKTQTEKISFLIQCDEWDWTIGSGFYTDDLNMIIEQKTKELTRKNDDNIRTIII
ncbi:MAG: cache domain-containing protein, partial [Arcobacteraceae bacterium]